MANGEHDERHCELVSVLAAATARPLSGKIISRTMTNKKTQKQFFAG
jgi:hypothetical protein